MCYLQTQATPTGLVRAAGSLVLFAEQQVVQGWQQVSCLSNDGRLGEVAGSRCGWVSSLPVQPHVL